MQREYRYCYATALQWARKYLPKRFWEDAACDFRLHIRNKAGSDELLCIWCETSPNFINHCARMFVFDYYRKLSRHRHVSTCHRFLHESAPTEWDIPDFHNTPDEVFVRKEFWEQFASFSNLIPKRSMDFLLMHYRDELSHAEIASKTSLKVDTVSQILSRAVRTIRTECERKGMSKGDLEYSTFAGGGQENPFYRGRGITI